jgi:hypothetical protein
MSAYGETLLFWVSSLVSANINVGVMHLRAHVSEFSPSKELNWRWFTFTKNILVVLGGLLVHIFLL